MKTQVYKLEVLVIDHDGLGPTEIAEVLENANYPNDCVSPKVMSIQSREVDWSDEHPLNKRTTIVTTYKELFDGK
jgi:hypothetical protein